MDNGDYGKEFLGLGFGFPVKTDPVTGRFLTASYEEDIKQAIYIFLLTRKGERLMRPDFGCGIYDYAFETMDYGTLSRMEKSVYRDLVTWEPRIKDIQVTVNQDGADSGRLNIHISYVVRSTNNPYNLVYPFYINEGMEV